MSGSADKALALQQAREAMIAKRFGGNTNGAKVSDGVRRKKQVAHVSQQDDKKLSAAIKKLQMQPITAVEEVNIFQNNGSIIHFNKPKIQAMVPNVFVVSGNAETKPMTDLLPGILEQLGPESIDRLRKIAEQMGAMGGAGPSGAGVENDDDDEVPTLVESFEDAAGK